MSSPDPLVLPEAALSEAFLAGTGPGGQNVNNVATAVQLRLDVYALRLHPEAYARLKLLAGSRWTNEGEIVVMARGRTREANRTAARERLTELVAKALERPVPRAKSRLNRVGKTKRLAGKAVRGEVKRGRGKVTVE